MSGQGQKRQITLNFDVEGAFAADLPVHRPVNPNGAGRNTGDRRRALLPSGRLCTGPEVMTGDLFRYHGPDTTLSEAGSLVMVAEPSTHLRDVV